MTGTTESVVQEQTVTSADGTLIAVSRVGAGPALVVVDGAMCSRTMGPSAAIATELAAHRTVFTYDRRGRGGSGDTAPYAVQREVEDLAAVIAATGGPTDVVGISSGGALVLAAADAGVPMRRLALYEVPFVVGPDGPVRPPDYVDRLDAMIAAGDRNGAVRTFLRTVGVPGFAVRLMRLMPAWKQMAATAHTLPYDFRVLGDTGAGKRLEPGRWPNVTAPVLSMDGGKSPQPMRDGMANLAEVLPAATHRTLPGQTHMLKAPAFAAALDDYLRT